MHPYTLDCSIQAVLARMLRELQDAIVAATAASTGLAESQHLGESGQDAAGAKKSAVAATKASTFEGLGLQNRSI